MQRPEVPSPPPTPSFSNERAGIYALVGLLMILPFLLALWLFGWGLAGAAWGYAARMWGC